MMTYYTGPNCTGTAFRSQSAGIPSQLIHWGYTAADLSTPVPFTVSAVEGAKTPASRIPSAGGTCEVNTSVRDTTYTLTPTSRDALGLPGTITGPLRIVKP